MSEDEPEDDVLRLRFLEILAGHPSPPGIPPMFIVASARESAANVMATVDLLVEAAKFWVEEVKGRG